MDMALGCSYTHSQIKLVKILADKIIIRRGLIFMSLCHGDIKTFEYLMKKCSVNVSFIKTYYIKYHSYLSEKFEVVKYLCDNFEICPINMSFRYLMYLDIHKKWNLKKRVDASKRIYFWWVQICYNPTTLSGHRSMQKGYREYLSIR